MAITQAIKEVKNEGMYSGRVDYGVSLPDSFGALIILLLTCAVLGQSHVCSFCGISSHWD